MASSAIRQNNIGGLMPSVHAVQSGEIRVLRGRNFRWHFDGPFSGFGNKLVSQRFDFDSPHYYGLFTMDDQSVLCTPNGIYTQDCETGCWTLAKLLTPARNLECYEHDYPWSTAFVGDTYYFSHPLVGIVKFERCTGDWSCVAFDSCGGDSDNPDTNAASTEPRFYDFDSVECLEANPVFGITEAGNRLIVLSRDTIGHSAIDDGCNLECDPFCGGGFVSSSIAKYGRPLGVYKSGNGFVAFTSNGIVQATNIDSIGAFGYRLVSSNTFPINPWAIASIGEGSDVVFLSKAGLAVASLNRETIVLTMIELEMSSWLCEKELFRNAYLHNQHAVMLTYAEETRELFVSMIAHRNQESLPHLYTRALVLNTKYKKWSTFDQPHYAIGPVNGSYHRVYDYTLGFVGLDKALHWFNEAGSNQRYNRNGAIVDDDLNSYIAIGPFGLTSESQIDLLSELQAIKLYTEGARVLANIEQPAETDPNYALEPDNYQDSLMVPFNATVYAYSSNDGYAHGSGEDLVACEPEIAASFVQTYTCMTTGLYHNLVIEANGVSGYYAVKRVDVKLLANGTIA